MKNHQQINQDSGNTEYYTPAEIVDAARRTMGGIELDPASSAIANQIVQATTFWTEKDDALNREWRGRVWMNHPFNRINNPKWIKKIVSQYEPGPHSFGTMDQGCCICYASTSEKWFNPLLLYPQCFLDGRTNYMLPDGTIKKGVTKGSVVTYFGENVEKFAFEFRNLGAVKVPFRISCNPDGV